MRDRLFPLSVLAIALVLFTASPGQPQASTNVDIQDSAFSPATITVPVGTTITWTNRDSIPHTVTSRDGAFDSGTLTQNESFRFTFNTAGTFNYFCRIHPSMTATITVTTAAQQEQIQEFSLIHSLKALKIYPATLAVKKGTKVRLFNTATDGSHPTVVISSDEGGQNPVFSTRAFGVEVGQLATVEFTPDREGEFFITHRTHGHNIVGRLLVQP